MVKKSQNLTQIFCVICGTVLLISGTLKSIDSGAFARLLDEYGIPGLEYLSPVVIICETLLGLALTFQIRTKTAALLAAIAITIFTCGYTYGLSFHNIENCGCFGQTDILNTSPTFLYIRNFILIAMLAYIATRPAEILQPASRIRKEHVSLFIVTIIATATVSYMTGLTFRRIHNRPEATQYEAIALSDSPLKEFVSTHPDSTYLIFAFTYKCPHCLNSIANLNNYESSGAVDHVMALAVADSVAAAKFQEQFNPAFPITDLSPEQLREITSEFPYACYINRDTIKLQFSGELPAPQVFSAAIKKLLASKNF